MGPAHEVLRLPVNQTRLALSRFLHPPQRLNHRYDKKETTQQKEQTGNREYKVPFDGAFDDKEQGANNKQYPTIQLKAYVFPYSLMIIFHDVPLR
jgi:hypothetical protein